MSKQLFWFTNARSIANKISELSNIVAITKPLFFCITETWLSNVIPTTALNLENYKIHRRDRESKGGGVLIAVRNDLLDEEMSLNFNTEICYVDLICFTKKIRIVCCYIPKSTDLMYLKIFFNELQLLINNSNHFIIVGDFNFPLMDWKLFPNENLPIAKSYELFNDFLLKNVPLSQLVRFPTR